MEAAGHSIALVTPWQIRELERKRALWRDKEQIRGLQHEVRSLRQELSEWERWWYTERWQQLLELQHQDQKWQLAEQPQLQQQQQHQQQPLVMHQPSRIDYSKWDRQSCYSPSVCDEEQDDGAWYGEPEDDDDEICQFAEYQGASACDDEQDDGAWYGEPEDDDELCQFAEHQGEAETGTATAKSEVVTGTATATSEVETGTTTATTEVETGTFTATSEVATGTATATSEVDTGNAAATSEGDDDLFAEDPATNKLVLLRRFRQAVGALHRSFTDAQAHFISAGIPIDSIHKVLGPTKRKHQDQHDTYIQIVKEMPAEQFDRDNSAKVLHMLQQGHADLDRQLREFIKDHG